MLGPMLVFLVRHAHADPGDPDEQRKLSERGRNEAEALADRLAAHGSPPRLVLTSPLLRARETAEALAGRVGAELRVDGRLAPGATATDVREAVEGESGSVAVVGHQPDCSEIARELTGRDPGFSTGSAFELTLDA
jgi:phosphohistidine phosphatase